MEIISVDVSIHGIHQDTDIFIGLDKADVNTLNNDATRAALGAIIIAGVPLVGPIVAVYVNERITQIVEQSGPNGCVVEVTIRDGTSLHVFSVHAK